MIEPTAYGRGSTIVRRAGVARGDEPGAERHLAVGQRRAVVDDEHAPSRAGRGRTSSFGGDLAKMTRRHRVDRLDVLEHLLDVVRLGRVDLVDDDDVGHAQVRLAGVVEELVPGPQRIGDDDQQVGREEREVVVAAVPDDDVGLLLGLPEDRLVVDARVHDHAHLDRLLVLLALLDRRMRRVDLLDRGEALDAHRLEVAVRHRMPDERDLQAGVEQDPADLAARLALAAARADRADRDDRLRRAASIVAFGPEQAEVGARREDDRRLVHDRLVREVGVGEDDLVDAVLA